MLPDSERAPASTKQAMPLKQESRWTETTDAETTDAEPADKREPTIVVDGN
jgi:hypothetical protein